MNVYWHDRSFDQHKNVKNMLIEPPLNICVIKSPASGSKKVDCSPLPLAQPTNVLESVMSAAEPAFATCAHQRRASFFGPPSPKVSQQSKTLASGLIIADSAWEWQILARIIKSHLEALSFPL